MKLRAFLSLLLLALMAACNHHSHRIKGVPAVVPCDDGDNASPTGEGHHDKPCRDEGD